MNSPVKILVLIFELKFTISYIDLYIVQVLISIKLEFFAPKLKLNLIETRLA